ncbi:MAG: hypothetical protein K2X00_23745 [Nitrospiraceae bacterium]|nr:hypothetical protein [Nitrospiraceae bacterium]
MPIISRDQADQIIRPYFPDFAQVIESAWRDWRTGGIAHQLQHKRVRANYVWNQLLSHAKRQFDGQPSVRVENMRSWDGVLIDDKIFIRMKKGTQELLSRNYPTQAALAFHDQGQDLFGGGIARLELLYILDDAEVEIERMVLVQRHKKSIAWAIDILNDADEAQNVIPFSLPQAPAGTPADRMLKFNNNETKENGQREQNGES